jgi:hypothetical protein
MAGWNKRRVDAFKAAFYDYLKHIVITSKETGTGPITLYTAQKIFLEEVFKGLENDIHEFVVLKARQLGMCYDPSMRVLLANHEWVKIDDIKVGDRVVSVDEEIPGGKGASRKMLVGVVEAKREVSLPAYEILMENGAKIIATGQHRHLCKSRHPNSSVRWLEVSKTKPGYHIRRFSDPWPSESSYEDGWIGGIIDGEGTLRSKDRAGVELSISQVDGPVLNRIKKYFNENGYTSREEIDDRPPTTTSKLGSKPVHKLVFGRMGEIFKIIGITKPSRFIDNKFWVDKELPGSLGDGDTWVRVRSITPIGVRRMIDIQTSAKTFVCEGFVSHNSTIVRALIVFWASIHPGLRVALVYDTDGNKEDARAEIQQFLDFLPETHKISVRTHNRNYLEIENGSRISYLVAGVKKTKSSGGLGRSRGINCAGCTEVSSWADIEGLKAFQRALAQKSDYRLFIWESTARGFNIFYDLWEAAKQDDLARKAIFIGWWAKEDYRLERGTTLFERYGRAPPNEDEKRKIKEVKEKYGYKVTAEQLAWYRHEFDPNTDRTDDDREGDEITRQELPWTEEEAFITTGALFFPTDVLTVMMSNAKKSSPKGYRYQMGKDFSATTLEAVNYVRHAHLKVWEEPDSNGVYVVGADPAYASSETSDRYVAEVLRCYADGVDQVAEFSARNIETYQFAWVIGHLCGAYKNARLLLELNGPGQAVWTAFRELEFMLRMGQINVDGEDNFKSVLSHVKHYLWARQDALNKNPTAFHWETTTKRKVMIMERFRDYVGLKQLNIRSTDLVSEMTKIVRDGDNIQGDGVAKDDRVMATALGLQAWEASEKRKLVTRGLTREADEKRRSISAADIQKMWSESLVQDFFSSRRREAALARKKEIYGNRRGRWGR